MVLIFRKKREGRLSIEKVFEPLLNHVEKVELPTELKSLSSALKIAKFLWKIRSKNIHVTGDIHYVTFLLFWKKSILTVHDLNNYEEKTGINKLVYGFIWFWLPLKTANVITVISPYTKQQLQTHFKVKEEKIVVINNSFVEPLSETVEAIVPDRNVTKILVIGTKKNKNIPSLVKAIKGMANIELLIVGDIDNKLMKLLRTNEICFKSFFNISEKELGHVYGMADILYFASTKEGFGLPILEAQSLGLPVITSKTCAMPYVAGDGAVLVDPYEVAEIKDAISIITDNIKERNRIVNNGFENIRRFSVDNFVSQYLTLYKTL